MIETFEIPKRILVIRLSSIGDIVLATPLLRNLKHIYPNVEIDFVIKQKFQEILYGNPNVSRIIPFNDKQGFSELRRIKKMIVQKKYDWLIDIHKNLRSVYLRTCSRAKRHFRYKKEIVRRFLLVRFKWNLYRSIVPIYRRYMAELEPFSVQDDNMGLDVYIDPIAKEKVSRRWRNFFESYPILVGMVPGAGYATKRWLPEGFAGVGERLIKKDGAGIILFGGPKDQALHDEINKRMDGKALTLAGKTSLQESFAAMTYCSCVVSNDTGLMHIAVALKKKLVAIFGATTEELGFFPGGNEQIILQNNELSCRPCSHIGSHRCPKHHFKCMKEISIEDVYVAVTNLLKK